MFNDSSDKSFMILQDPHVAQRIDSPFDLELEHEACLDPAKSKQQEQYTPVPISFGKEVRGTVPFKSVVTSPHSSQILRDL
jgi:hypothetical protein